MAIDRNLDVRLHPGTLERARARHGRALASYVRDVIRWRALGGVDLSPRHVGQGGLLSERYCLRLDAELFEQLRALAAECRLTPARLVGRIIDHAGREA